MPVPRATCVAAGMPMKVISIAKIIADGVRVASGRTPANAAHNKTVAAEAQLPGPGRSRPMPKNVARVRAHIGVCRVVVDSMIKRSS